MKFFTFVYSAGNCKWCKQWFLHDMLFSKTRLIFRGKIQVFFNTFSMYCFKMLL
jgi:hypothetical protein